LSRPHSAKGLTSVPDAAWETARRRERIVRALLQNPVAYGARSEAVAAAAAELDVTIQYLYRLIKVYAYVNELRPTLLTNVGSPWLQWLLITDAARPSQPARPFGAVQKAARRPCRVANTLIMRQRLAWPGCV